MKKSTVVDNETGQSKDSRFVFPVILLPFQLYIIFLRKDDHIINYLKIYLFINCESGVLCNTHEITSLQGSYKLWYVFYERKR